VSFHWDTPIFLLRVSFHRQTHISGSFSGKNLAAKDTSR